MNKQKILLCICGIVALSLGVIGFLIGKGFAPAQDIENKHLSHQHETAEETTWTCSMHPQIKLNKPGKCPICGMDLIPLKKGEQLGSREIKLSKMAEKLANIEVMPAIRKEFYFSVPMVGKISLDETRSKKITSRYAGRLDRLFVDYTGIEVKKGVHLFEIYSPQLITAQEELLQAIESAKAMQKSTVKAIRESSEKAVEASRDKLRLWGLTDQQINDFEKSKLITDHLVTYSPTGGIVIKKHLDEGSYVKEGTQIYSIANLDYLWVELDAYESDLQWLHYAQEVNFTAEALPGEEFKGRISFIHPVLNNKTRTVKIRVNVDNKDRRLKPDMFVRAKVRVNINAAGKVIDHALAGKWISPMHPEIISDKPGPCPVCDMPLVKAEEYGFTPKGNQESPLVIPSSAPLITGKRSVVYLKSRNNEGVYEGRTITLGLKAADYYIVKSGLKQGDLVVTKGAFKIDSALQILAKPSMMSEDVSALEYNYKLTLPFKKSVTAVYKKYDQISVELSKDRISNIKKNVESLLDSLQNVVETEETEPAEHWRKISREIELAANVFSLSNDIESARKSFERLSLAMINSVRVFGSLEDINLAYCPMAFNDKGAAWLQFSNELANPYFGSKMFSCGDFKEKFSHRVKNVSLSKSNAAQLEKATQVYSLIANDLAEDKVIKLSQFNVLLSTLEKIDMKTMNEEVHLSFMKEFNKIKSSVSLQKEDSSLSEQRIQFQVISSSFISLLDQFNYTSKEVFRLHCPMAFGGKGAAWLQFNDKTKNPYLGLNMQQCGDVKETYKVVSKEADPHKHHEMEKKEEADPHKHHNMEKKEEADPHKHHKMEKKEEAGINQELIKSYLKIHKALSQDRFPETGKTVLVNNLKKLNAGKLVIEEVEKLFKTDKINEARSAFKTLSDFLISKVKLVSPSLNLNIAHCPMAFDGKGAFWLQGSDKVENPYYGNRMYRCGSIKEKVSGGK